MTSQEQGPLYKCMVGIQERRRAVTWTWALPGTKPGERSLRRGRGRGLAGLSPEDMRAAVLSPCPSAFHPPLPTCPGEGPLGPGLGGGGTLSVSNTGLLGYTSPSPCALDPNPALPSCARRMYPEGALLGRLQSTVQTLVGWEPPSPRGEEGGKGFRTQPGQMTSPRGLDQSRVLGHPRKGLLSAPGGNGSSSPSHHCRMGEREDCRVWAGDGTEAVQVWGKEDAPHSQALERYKLRGEIYTWNT